MTLSETYNNVIITKMKVVYDVMSNSPVHMYCTDILMEQAAFIFRVDAMLVTIYQTTMCHIPDKS